MNPLLVCRTASRVAAASRLPVTRRAFLAATGAAATSALAGCGSSALPGAVPPGTVPTEGPETKSLKFGMIALTDCSPLVIAHEKGFFKKYGIESTISKGASWAAIRDSLSNGDIQATHMLLGMPLASTMGLLGSPKKPMVIPWLLNRNGQAITLKAELKGKVAGRPEGPQAACRCRQGRGHADDVRDDLSARHARHVDAVLPGRGRHQSGRWAGGSADVR